MMMTIQSQVGTVILSLEASPTLRRADPYLQLPEPQRNGWPAAGSNPRAPRALPRLSPARRQRLEPNRPAG